jgi:hypothetical protein
LTFQVQGVVIKQEVLFRPRRQLLVVIRDEHGDELFLRWLNFYPSQQKQMAVAPNQCISIISPPPPSHGTWFQSGLPPR